MSEPQNKPVPAWQLLEQNLEKICKSVPPIEPPEVYWLESDASLSYCQKHAWEARWKELPTTGPCPNEKDCPEDNDITEFMRNGFEAYSTGMPGEADHPETCSVCGITLDYVLTDYGRNEELRHYEENPINEDHVVDGELTYALSTLFMNLLWEGADETQVQSALKISQDTLLAIENGHPKS